MKVLYAGGSSARVAPFYGLSLAAGCVDAIAFLRFGDVFTANMTGNTVLLSIAAASRLGSVFNSLGIGPPLLAIAAFVIGATVTLPAFRNGFDAHRAALLVLAEAIMVALAGTAFATLHGQFVISLRIVLIRARLRNRYRRRPRADWLASIRRFRRAKTARCLRRTRLAHSLLHSRRAFDGVLDEDRRLVDVLTARRKSC